MPDKQAVDVKVTDKRRLVQIEIECKLFHLDQKLYSTHLYDHQVVALHWLL